MTPTPYVLQAGPETEPRFCLQMGVERSQRWGLADWVGKEPGVSSQKTSRELRRTPRMKLKISHFILTIQVHEQRETSNKLQEIYGWGENIYVLEEAPWGMNKKHNRKSSLKGIKWAATMKCFGTSKGELKSRRRICRDTFFLKPACRKSRAWDYWWL